MHINSGDKIISDIILFDNDGNGYKFKYVLENVFNLLKLKSYSTGSMVGGDNNTKKTNLTKLNLTLPDYNKFIHVTVGVIPNRQEFDVILGIDIISYCNVNISTNSTGFTFNIDLPICR